MRFLPLSNVTLRLTLLLISLAIKDAFLQHLIIHFVHLGNSFLFLSRVVIDGLLLSLLLLLHLLFVITHLLKKLTFVILFGHLLIQDEFVVKRVAKHDIGR